MWQNILANPNLESIFKYYEDEQDEKEKDDEEEEKNKTKKKIQ